MGKEDVLIYWSSISKQLCSKEKESSLARELLKKGFPEFFHMEYREEEIRKQKYGKPFDRRSDQIQFSISHCKGRAVVALSDQKVGIDVEGMRRVNAITVKKCCSREETEYVFGEWNDDRIIRGVLSEEETMRFIKLWTLKESYVKMTGQGLRTPFDQVCFQTEDLQGEWDKNLREIRGITEDGSRHFLCLHGQFAVALTILGIKNEVNPHFIWKEFFCK